ncbi:MAG: hypothetical protein JM58_13155 [Peptococcaceae bacterium BICA1-8]|nr:MAG: hypothetical protein JM58_13155 [Peptococcaceae bacterium BICA1-8]
MKIILRKRDSVVSIVLFIYNIFREHSGSKSLRLNHLIEFMKYFDKSETAVRMGLSRSVKSGILINRKIGSEIYYDLTQLGIDNLKLWNQGVSRFFQRYALRNNGSWNNKWYLLALQNFSKSADESQVLRDELRELGMLEVIKDLWVSPYEMTNFINELVTDKYDYLNFVGEFDLSDTNKIVNTVFNIDVVRNEYLQFIAFAKGIEQNLTKVQSQGDYLPLLFELGWNFFDIATSDPTLPRDLLADWPGDEAVQLMGELRSFLYGNITKYFDEIASD